MATSSVCSCFSNMQSRYKRLVNNVFPSNPAEGAYIIYYIPAYLKKKGRNFRENEFPKILYLVTYLG